MKRKKKRDLASTSSGQPTQSKKPCLPAIKKTSNGLESDLLPKSDLTAEDIGRVVREQVGEQVREQLEHFKSSLLESCILNTIKVDVQDLLQICSSLKDTGRIVKEAVELGNIRCPYLRRANAKSMAKNGCFPERNLQLRFQTKLSVPVYAGHKLEGEGGTGIFVALFDANTGHEVTSGPESSAKLDFVVLHGDFNGDNQDNWAQDEFEKNVVEGRKGPLLTCDVPVRLKEGVAELGELTFNDNSSWTRSKSFKIAVKVASGCFGYTQIREGITDDFRVLDERGEDLKKHYPPALEDDVYRLEKIAKGGEYHTRLSAVGIHKVEDFLLQMFTDSEKLTQILKISIKSKNWSTLEKHAKTCKTNWELSSYYPDGKGKHGAIFNSGHQLIGIIKNRVYVATHRFSAQDKEHADKIMEAFHNLKDVRELNGETVSGSMQTKSSRFSPSQVLEGKIDDPTLALVPPNLALGTNAAAVGSEAPLANPGSIDERHIGVSASPLPVHSQNTYSGNAVEFSADESVVDAHWPKSDSSLQYATGSERIDPSSQRDYTMNELGLSLPSSSALPVPECNFLPDDLQSLFSNWEKHFSIDGSWSADIPDV